MHKIEITGYTETHCGECQFKQGWKAWCALYRDRLEWCMTATGPERLPDCIADEKAQREGER